VNTVLTICFAITRAIHFGSSLLVLSVLVFDQIMRGMLKDTWLKTARRLIWIALMLAAISGAGWFVIVAMNMSDAGISELIHTPILQIVWSQTQFGELWKWRAILWITCALTVSWRITKPLAMLSAILFVASLAWSGHGQTGPARAWHLSADIIHLLICSIWPVGLLPFVMFLTQLRRTSAERSLVGVTYRFSTASLASVALLILTGMVNAFCLLGSFHALFTTQYGHMLLLKLALFLAMISLGAVNLLVLKPRLLSDDPAMSDHARQLQRNASIELAIGIFVMLVVGLLGTLPPANP
jgi:copper resistance protein D